MVGHPSSDGVAPDERARAALACVRHRGPDSHGEYRDGSVWLGHVRLSILDLSAMGAQPMATPDGRFVISYNGEVYNFRELAAELSLADLRSHSDTEVVLRAFERLGDKSFVRLNGIFAFAIYDRARQKLWLVRDRLGVKPLYYRFDAQGLAFASEIKAVLAISDAAPGCELPSLHEWLYYGVSLGGRTLYQGVHQLLPGHFLELDLGSFKSHIAFYWSLGGEARRLGPVQDATPRMIRETRRLLDDAVRRQLVSDVPVGVFLSGGVDSSAITAFAAKHCGGRLSTYSAGFSDDARGDELPVARRVAAHFGTDHHEMDVRGADMPDLVEKMVQHHDQPFADAANIPLYLMARQVASHTKVVLQGDGGDEVFGGYRRYATLRYYPYLHHLSPLGLGALALLPASVLKQRAQRYLRAYGANELALTMALLLTPEDARFDPTSVFSPDIRRVVAGTDPFARFRECQARVRDRDLANQMTLVDMWIELPDVFLEKVDRATMAASLEARVPFLDNELVSYVTRIPGSRKMPWGRKKWLLKQVLAGIVPDWVLNRPKTGFNVPFDRWLRSSLRSFLFDHLARFERQQPGIIQRAVVDQWYARTMAGREDNSFMLWKILNFVVWCNLSGVRVK